MSSEFLCLTIGMERFFLHLPRVAKKYRICGLKVACGGVLRL